MRLLVGIPVLSGYQHTKDAIESVLSQKDVDLLLIDNGADYDIKELFKTYSDNSRVNIIVYPQNIYVNPAWNRIIKQFLSSLSYDCLVIMNSDLVMHKDWSKVLLNRLYAYANETYLPTIINDKMQVDQEVRMESNCQEVSGGVAGVFITLTKAQAKLVYPITEECLVWYGDNWIYEILRGLGHKMIILDNLIAHHGISQTIYRLTGIDEIISFDTKLWPEVQLKIQDIIDGRNRSKQSSTGNSE